MLYSISRTNFESAKYTYQSILTPNKPRQHITKRTPILLSRLLLPRIDTHDPFPKYPIPCSTSALPKQQPLSLFCRYVLHPLQNFTLPSLSPEYLETLYSRFQEDRHHLLPTHSWRLKDYGRVGIRQTEGGRLWKGVLDRAELSAWCSLR